MSFQSRDVNGDSFALGFTQADSPRIISLLEQVQSARVRADQIGLKSSEIALRRAVIAMSKELGVPSGLDSRELLFID